ncbi:unnamed protein product [Ascophyllum nodosum]
MQEIIAESRELIVHELKDAYLDMSIHIQKYIVDKNILMSPEHDPKEYYRQTCFPAVDFLDFVNDVKNNLKPSLEREFKCSLEFKPYIFKHIHSLSHNGMVLLDIKNIFYPYLNSKYKLDSHQGTSRFDLTSIQELHPKYLLEDRLTRAYDLLENDDHINEDINNAKLGGKTFQRKCCRLGLDQYTSIKKYVILCNIDGSYTNCLCRSKDVPKIMSVLGHQQYKKYNSISASDMRHSNISFFDKGKVVLRIWPTLDYDFVPMADKNRVHIYVAMKYAMIDYVTNHIFGINHVSQHRLEYFNHLCVKMKDLSEKRMLFDVEKCERVGTYYPTEEYLKQLRIDKIVEGRRK